jgi:hypothetical protein
MRILKDEVKDGAEASVPDHPATQVHETIAREPEKELRTP